jgi:hypothetical protein
MLDPRCSIPDAREAHRASGIEDRGSSTSFPAPRAALAASALAAALLASSLAVLALLPPAFGEDAPPIEKFAGERWMGVYIRGEKAGWLRTSLLRESRDGRPVWVVAGEGRMAFVVLDRKSAIESSERTVYEAAPPYRFLEHESSVSTSDSSSRLEIRAAGDAFDVVVTRGGERRVRRAAFRHTLLDALAPELLAAAGSGVGAERAAVVFLSDLPDEEGGKARVERVLEGPAGREVEISSESPRLRRRSRIGADGAVLEVRIGPGFVLLAQPKPEAVRMGSGADLSKLSVSAFVDRPLGVEARKVRRLVLSAEGLPAADLPRDGRQQVEEGPDGRTLLTLERPAAPAPCVRVPPEIAPWLAADADLASDHEELRALARRVAGAETDLHRRARLLCAWVHANLRKTSRSFLSSALDVLRRREGDCTEHALLAAALCRAAGVPARTVVGLAYAGDEKRVFGFHAWIEAWCGTWTAMDPTWGEALADATHVKLAEGRDPYALLPFLGEIRVKVVEVAAD